MARTEIDAVELTRRVRAKHAERLHDATPGERIRFYRDKARRLTAAIEAARDRGKATRVTSPPA